MCEKCNTLDEHIIKASEDDEEGFYDNEDFDEIEGNDYYNGMQDETLLELKNQRDELVLAGVIWTIFNTFGKDTLKRIGNGEGTKEDLVKLQTYIQGQAEKKVTPISIDYKGTLQNYLLYATQIGGQSILDSRKIRARFSVESQFLSKNIQERINGLTKGLTQTTAKEFAKVVIAGLRDGQSAKKMTKEMLKYSDKISAVRAKRIIITETNAAIQFARREVAKKLGATTKTRWTNPQETTCRYCTNLNGTTVGIDDTFGGVDIAPLHTNCQCWIEYGFESNMENVNRDGL